MTLPFLQDFLMGAGGFGVAGSNDMQAIKKRKKKEKKKSRFSINNIDVIKKLSENAIKKEAVLLNQCVNNIF